MPNWAGEPKRITPDHLELYQPKGTNAFFITDTRNIPCSEIFIYLQLEQTARMMPRY